MWCEGSCWLARTMRTTLDRLVWRRMLGAMDLGRGTGRALSPFKSDNGSVGSDGMGIGKRRVESAFGTGGSQSECPGRMSWTISLSTMAFRVEGIVCVYLILGTELLVSPWPGTEYSGTWS
eukprot:TRINITY_DN10881_c0_g1_i17.p2 TRINITY_DN10881_c0_g1~~TRINITY_DN10881_c0_g1_i17.p2  ORF type:complete len:121 (-),score=2.63 TRINITY_DN10881_c0_g1_i17:894-1256(-)